MTAKKPKTKAKTAPRKPRVRKRFEEKRELIIIAATNLINEQGTKGTTLLDVAKAVGLNTTSVTYYFRRKELLAAAVFEQTLTRLEKMVQDAGEAATPQERMSEFLAAAFRLHRDVIRGEGLPLAKLSDLRTLEDSIRLPLEKHWQEVFRKVRGYFGPARDETHKALLTARAHMLLEVVFWLPIWVSQYALVDFPRVYHQLIDILNHGIASPGAKWEPAELELDPADSALTEGSGGFLRVATRLINDAGYRGASVVRIADEVNVTKGSFYHHLEGKDDLVLEGFRRSYGRYSLALSRAEEAGDDGWHRISTAIATLLNIQFYGEWPLLRTTALQSLPVPLRNEVVLRSNRTALRFSGTLIEGMRDESLRIVDPLIASQLIIATVNTAYDLRKWASRLPPEKAIAFYASTLTDGLFDEEVLAAIGD